MGLCNNCLPTTEPKEAGTCDRCGRAYDGALVGNAPRPKRFPPVEPATIGWRYGDVPSQPRAPLGAASRCRRFWTWVAGWFP